MTHHPEGLARDLIADLLRASDPARAAHGACYHPTALTLCGASVPALRSALRTHRSALRALPPRDRADLAALLVHSGLFEAALLAHLLLDGDHAALATLTPTDLDRGPAGLGAHVDNWVLTDTFGPLVLGVCWRTGVIGDGFIARWLDDADPWYRRLTLTATIALNTRARGGTGDSARTRWVCEAALDDRAPMMVKALSWALREWAGPDPAAVADFCATHDARLAALVRREVRTRLETGTKRGRR
jgi:3-methyladenine DNA glycosylase AlkD